MHNDQIIVITIPMSPSVITSVCWELAKTSLVLWKWLINYCIWGYSHPTV